ncbi:hypothetical protein LINPERHAP1_LOCUS31693 [Linum perenne]
MEGMKLAWNLCVRNLAIQMDSVIAVKILRDGSQLDHQHANLTRRFQDMLGWDWAVSLSHFYRERNFLTDSLAAKLKLTDSLLVLIQLRV